MKFFKEQNANVKRDGLSFKEEVEDWIDSTDKLSKAFANNAFGKKKYCSSVRQKLQACIEHTGSLDEFGIAIGVNEMKNLVEKYQVGTTTHSTANTFLNSLSNIVLIKKAYLENECDVEKKAIIENLIKNKINELNLEEANANAVIKKLNIQELPEKPYLRHCLKRERSQKHDKSFKEPAAKLYKI